MNMPRIKSAAVVRFPIVQLAFEDGLVGEIDHAREIETGKIFAPLRDPSYFEGVAVSVYGHSYGWNLDDVGHEIDFGAASARISIETALVAEMAEKYRRRTITAE